MKTKYAYSIASIMLLIVLLAGCNVENPAAQYSDQTTEKTEEATEDTTSETSENASIKLNNSSISSSDNNVVIEDNIATITKAGTYTVSGTLSDGQIIVEASDEDDVEIILDNVEISCSFSSPIYIKTAKNVKITLAENSTNSITDNREAGEDDDEDAPNAAIYSKSDLKIKGDKKSLLKVTGNLNDAITSKDDLEIKEANIEIIAKDDGIRGKDSLEITESTLVIDVDGDAIKSDNTEDEEKGIVTIEDSDITISAGDDAIHATQLVEVLSGNINIQESYEGIEGKKIIIHDGTITITSKDDGLNVAEKQEDTDEDTGMFGGRDGGGGMFAVLEGGELNIYGGTITLNTGGDGFDSNGNATMTGGTLIINGPTNSGNGALDVNGTFLVSGGTIIAVGSSGMAETPSEESSQYSIQVNLEQTQTAGTIVSLQDSSGKVIFTYTTTKQFQSVTYSSEALKNGETYTFFVNDEEYTSLTIESIITKYGTGSMGMGGGMMGGGNRTRPDMTTGDTGTVSDTQMQGGPTAGGTPPNMNLPDNWDTMTDEERREYMESNRPENGGMIQ